jgi:hypothetical protein
MRPEDHYRRIAKECLDSADRTADDRQRDRLAQIASAWKQMAAQWEQTSARIREFAERRNLKYALGDPDFMRNQKEPSTRNSDAL